MQSVCCSSVVQEVVEAAEEVPLHLGLMSLVCSVVEAHLGLAKMERLL